MAQGLLYRTGIAIVLMATLLLPYGRCQAPARAASHDCCEHSVPLATVGTNCCIVRSQLPAVVVKPAAAPSPRFASAVFVVPAAGPAMRFGATTRADATHLSSPPGPFVLRI